MARQLISGSTVKALPQTYYPATPLDAGSADLVWTSSGDQPDREIALTTDGKLVLYAHNTDSGAQTITISGVVDDKNRLGDITDYSIAAGKTSRFGPFARAGWANAGKLFIDLSDPLILLSAEILP